MELKNIKQKSALVTGGSGGIGAEICRTLAGNGYLVFVHYHTGHDRAVSLANAIGGQAVCADLRSPSAIRQMMLQIGDLDVLVNNAGIEHTGLFTHTSPETWRDLFAVNVDGAYHVTHQALPAMIRQKSGSIVNIASMWGEVGASCEVAYSATKAALLGMTKSLAKELAPSCIRVNAVSPGAVETEMLSNLSSTDKEAIAADTPLGRLGTPKDVAVAVAFLCSDKASFITGQVLSVNGGMVI